LAKEPEVGADKFVLPLGVSMFFSFLKMIIILLIFRFLIFDLYVMITSSKSNYC
jgi:flagellar biogenesis protein FliO